MVISDRENFDAFWEVLTWDKLERRIREALSRPDMHIPLETNCPAVRDLANQILQGLVSSAIQRPGEMVFQSEAFNFDQRLIIFRIIEAVVSEYEDWKNARSPGIETGDLISGFRSLE